MTPAQNAKNARSASVTKTTTYSITVDDAEVLCNATALAFTVTLFTAVGNAGRMLVIKNIGSVNDVTVASAGGTIDGETTFTIPFKCSMSVISDGANWHIM